MKLLFLLLLPTAFGLFFDLGGGGGGCSCQSSCAAPPPTNFGCRLMCAGQTLACQQQSYNQGYTQPNYGYPAPALAPAYNTYQNNYNYQSPSNYARQLPQFTYSQPTQPQAVAPAAQYVPPAPSRYVDSYVTAGNQAATNYRPQPPVAPPVYAPQVVQPTSEHQPVNPLPASFVSVAQPAHSSYSSESSNTEEVRLLPPEQPQSIVVQAVQPVPSQQNANYAPAPEATGKATQVNSDFSLSVAEKPEDIVKSIEESYDEQTGEESDQKVVTASAPKLDFKTLTINQATSLPNVNYVTTERILPAFQTEDNVEEPDQVQETKTVEYALGSPAPAKAAIPVEQVTSVPQYKTLTRGEGTSAQENISQSGYDYKDGMEKKAAATAAPEVAATTEDYVAEEKGESEQEQEETGETEESSGYKKLREEERQLGPFPTTTSESKHAKRSQSPDSTAFKCNSAKLRQIMEEKMTVSAPVSKQLIYAEATAEFPGLSLDVICSRHSFSYIVVTSPIYCEHRKSPLTCFAFFQP